MTDDLAKKEQFKYTRMWAIPSYRRIAPGERHVEKAIEAFNMKPPESILDFGTGTGRAAQAFKEAGFDVTGIDHAMNCLDIGIDIPLLVACLWDLPDIVADYGFCTDVMEHVPEEKVDEVLKGIAQRVNDAYFAIDTIPDSMGKLIGETLHVTVKPGLWWYEKLVEYFDDVTFSEGKHSAVLICRGSKT